MNEQRSLQNWSSSDNSTDNNLQRILVQKTSPMLVQIKNEKGQQAAIGVLVAMMDSCQQYFNLQQPMQPMQLALTAELIMEDYYYLRVEELQLCFRMAMKGEFGPLYNRIDGQVFFEWIKKYLTKRGQITERIQQDKQQGNNIYEIFQHPQIQQAMQDAADRLSIKEAPKVEAKRDKPSRIEQMLMDEYDALQLWNDDMRFRVYKNRPYQFTEYRMERYKELIENQNEY